MQEVKQNDKVKVHYKGTLKDGTVFDSSEDREPLEFTVGGGQVIPGFETGVIGMNVDDTKTLNISADDAYGQVREDLVQEIPKDALPEDMEPTVGLDLIAQTEEGTQINVKVTEVKDNTVIIDANHPLAGEDLTFEVTLVEIGA